MPQIEAAVCQAFGEPLRLERLELRAPQGREIEVTLSAVAICHSDITYAAGDWGGTLPAVYGHEAAGVVTALGPQAEGVALGARVVVTLLRACGSCAACRSGQPFACCTPHDAPPALTRADGTPVVKAMHCGAFAERVLVDPSQVVELPDDIEMDVASLLSCGVITGIGAVVNSARLRPGQDAVVIGVGGIGLNVIQGARLAGARRIVAVDLAPDKLEMARAFGATDGVLASGPAPWEEAQRLLGRGADAVFVATGAIRAYRDAALYLGFGGRVIALGMPPVGAKMEIEPVDMASCGHGMHGSKMGDTVIQRDIPWLVDLYRQGRLKLDELISGRWRLEQINEAIADTKTGHAKRNVILFDSPDAPAERTAP
jgi:S-(hydroxymethyl)mycothiol dehydrogenase